MRLTDRHSTLSHFLRVIALVHLYFCFYTHSYSDATDDIGRTPLNIAIQSNFTEITDYLQLQQCKLNTVT